MPFLCSPVTSVVKRFCFPSSPFVSFVVNAFFLCSPVTSVVKRFFSLRVSFVMNAFSRVREPNKRLHCSHAEILSHRSLRGPHRNFFRPRCQGRARSETEGLSGPGRRLGHPRSERLPS